MSDYLEKGEIIRTIARAPQYAISNFGNVYHTFYGGKLKKMKTGFGKNGYAIVRLYGKSSGVTILVHIEVAKAFLPKPLFRDMKTVNHKNGKKYDNRVENLEWATYRQNIMHSLYILGNKIQPVAAYDANGKIYAVAASIKQMCVLKFNEWGVLNALKGKQNHHHGYTFRRLTIQEYNNYVGQHFCIGHKILYAHE